MSNCVRIIHPGEFMSVKEVDENEVIGMKFNRLTIIGIERRGSENRKHMKCICDCQKNKIHEEIKYTYVRLSSLINGINNKKGGIKSCGCLHDELAAKRGKNNKRSNIYDLESFDYGVGYLKDGYEFYFDKEDYELISKYCWHKHHDGYLRTCYKTYKDSDNKYHNKYIMMHQLIGKKHNLYNPEIKEELDHIDGKTNNNRKDNLRTTDHMTNMKNGKIKSNNTSGYKGVSWFKYNNKWCAYITNEKKRIFLGYYENKEDAIKVRKNAEILYFGDHNRKEEYL